MADEAAAANDDDCRRLRRRHAFQTVFFRLRITCSASRRFVLQLLLLHLCLIGDAAYAVTMSLVLIFLFPRAFAAQFCTVRQAVATRAVAQAVCRCLCGERSQPSLRYWPLPPLPLVRLGNALSGAGANSRTAGSIFGGRQLVYCHSWYFNIWRLTPWRRAHVRRACGSLRVDASSSGSGSGSRSGSESEWKLADRRPRIAAAALAQYCGRMSLARDLVLQRGHQAGLLLPKHGHQSLVLPF